MKTQRQVMWLVVRVWRIGGPQPIPSCLSGTGRRTEVFSDDQKDRAMSPFNSGPWIDGLVSSPIFFQHLPKHPIAHSPNLHSFFG